MPAYNLRAEDKASRFDDLQLCAFGVAILQMDAYLGELFVRDAQTHQAVHFQKLQTAVTSHTQIDLLLRPDVHTETRPRHVDPCNYITNRGNVDKMCANIEKCVEDCEHSLSNIAFE